MITKVTTTFADGSVFPFEFNESHILKTFRYLKGKHEGRRPVLIQVEVEKPSEMDWKNILDLKFMLHPRDGRLEVHIDYL